MQEYTLPLMIAALTAVPFILAYWVGRFVSRRRMGRLLRLPRPWQLPTLEGWARSGWLDPELIEALPAEVSPATVFYHWAAVDPDVARGWRLREPLTETTPFEAVVRDVWRNLPADQQRTARERLAEAVVTAGTWWGGAERGWTGRPLSLPAASVPRKAQGLPLLGMPDLTAAPMPGPVHADAAAAEADGVDLVLILVALRASQPRFMHPLAPKANSTHSLVQGLSSRVAVDVGRQVGARVGGMLGPIGAMVGQYLGEMAGTLGASKLAQQTLPEPIASSVKQTEEALARLGELAMTDDFARGAGQPAEAILETGKRVEVIREERNRRLRERLWPTRGLVLVEEVLWVALDEMKRYRTAAEVFVKTAREANPSIAGGMILQNPWLVRSLPGGVERLNAARQALNRAALAVKQYRG